MYLIKLQPIPVESVEVLRGAWGIMAPFGLPKFWQCPHALKHAAVTHIQLLQRLLAVQS
jgi:hypothetical protein